MGAFFGHSYTMHLVAIRRSLVGCQMRAHTHRCQVAFVASGEMPLISLVALSNSTKLKRDSQPKYCCYPPLAILPTKSHPSYLMHHEWVIGDVMDGKREAQGLSRFCGWRLYHSRVH